MFGVTVDLWMETCGKVKIHAKVLEQISPNVPGKAGSRSLMICLESPQYFIMFLKNNRAASSAVQPAVTGIKVHTLKTCPPRP